MNDISSTRYDPAQLGVQPQGLVVARHDLCCVCQIPIPERHNGDLFIGVRSEASRRAGSVPLIGTVDGPTTYDRAWPPLCQERCIPASTVRRSQPSPSRLRLTTAARQSWDKAWEAGAPRAPHAPADASDQGPK